MQEEIFGPVCSIAKFKTEEDAIRVGNSTTYGLAAAVHTNNLNTAIRVSNALRAGTVWVYVFTSSSTLQILNTDPIIVTATTCSTISFRSVGSRSPVLAENWARLLFPTTLNRRPFRSVLEMLCSVKRLLCKRSEIVLHWALGCN